MSVGKQLTLNIKTILAYYLCALSPKKTNEHSPSSPLMSKGVVQFSEVRTEFQQKKDQERTNSIHLLAQLVPDNK